jgi:hypothetical protein
LPKADRSAAFKAIREEFKATLPEGTVLDKFLSINISIM